MLTWLHSHIWQSTRHTCYSTNLYHSVSL